MRLLAALLLLACGAGAVRHMDQAPRQPPPRQPPVRPWVRFLVAVNDTWDPDGCLEIVKTAPLSPGVPLEKAPRLQVGRCDSGPFVFNMSVSKNMTVFLTFHSSVILDASPPTCTITWSDYLKPPPTPSSQPPNLLPGCVTAESREGYHMTYYWFYVLEWGFH